MSWETELKMRVASHDPVREKLHELRAALVGKFLEINEIFDRPDGALRRRGVGLRIRSTRPHQVGGDDLTILTVKGPRLPGVVKSREEVEFPVPSAETASRALNLLGFVRVLRYQKRRESWRLGECRVELDEPPHIGLFVEIEGPDEGTIFAMRRTLGLDDAEPVAESYVHMLSAYCADHGITDRVVELV
ncbi:MAG: class IV adenylate cyclase [Planctomycetes bacterium]|nr:class IV adenylate cyclase [Planctomycetota bacterium]